MPIRVARKISLAFIFLLIGFYFRHLNIFPTKNILKIDNLISEFIFSKGSRKSISCKNYEFTLINANAPYGARDGAGAVYFDKKLFLIGGWNPNDKENFPKNTSNDVWKSEDYGISWENIKPNTYNHNFRKNKFSDFEGRHYSGFIVHKNYIYIVGGDEIQGRHINDIWKSKNGKDWELVNANPEWAPRAFHVTFSYKEYMYVMGGQTMPKTIEDIPNKTIEDEIKNNDLSEIYYRDIWRSKDGKDWEKVKIKNNISHLVAGIGGSGFVLNDFVYIPGGFSATNYANKKKDYWKKVWKSEGDLSSWEKVSDLGPNKLNDSGKSYFDTATYDNKIWVIGGHTVRGWRERDSNQIWNSSNGIDWYKLNCSPLKPTHSTSIWSTEEGLIISAGHGWSKKIWKLSKIE